jgi:3-phosphoshikimate 1-carboxyvinyltransferase
LIFLGVIFLRKAIKKAGNIKGEINLSGDKSISHRIAIIGAISNGITAVKNFSLADDCISTLNCLEDLGVEFYLEGTDLKIFGRGKYSLSKPRKKLNAENSGTTIRLFTGILSAQNFDSEITGDDSLIKRPMLRVVEPLRRMGAEIETSDNGTAPLKIFGKRKLKGIEYELEVQSAQVKSAIILAGLYADGETKIIEKTGTRDHTERILNLYTHFDNSSNKKIIFSNSSVELSGKEYYIPADISSAIFFIVSAFLLPDSEIEIKNVGLNPTRTAVLEILKKIGANIEIKNFHNVSNEPIGDIIVYGYRDDSVNLYKGVKLNGSIIPNIIDEIPILSIVGAVLGNFEVRDAFELRKKETDRIKAIVTNLKKMGADITEFEDGFRIESSTKLKGAELQSFGDHRIVMSFAVAGLIAEGETLIDNAESVSVSFPNFWEVFENVCQY